MKKSTCFEGRQVQRRLAPAITVIGSICGLAAVPAGALELGDIQAESALGQPLRASITYALGSNERLYENCIRLIPPASGNGIPSVTDARVSLNEGMIVLTSSAVVKDPLLIVRLAVDCSNSPRLQREYTLMLSPHDATTTSQLPAYIPNQQAASRMQHELQAPAAGSKAAVRTSVPRSTVDGSPISAGSTYRVQIGDTASSIASRIVNPGGAVEPAILAIVQANPDAFVGGDADQLVAGSLLAIPEIGAAAAADEVVEPAVAEAMEAPAEPAGEPGRAPVSDANTPIATQAATATEPALDPVTGFASEPAESDTASPSFSVGVIAAEDTTELSLPNAAAEDLRPGDVVVAPAEQLAAPESTDILPIEDADLPQATESNAPETGDGWSWLFWLAVASLATILALLMPRTRLRERFATGGAAVATEPADEQEDRPIPDSRNARDVDVDFDELEGFDTMSLDADFSDGTGLSDSTEIDVRQDFGFAEEATKMTKVDFEISEDLAREPEPQPTDIIPPTHRIEESSILEAEIRGADLTGDYDLSMIIDATKQPIGDYDRTAQDLQAVRVDDHEYLLEDLTMSDDVEIKILAQDYEAEFAEAQGGLTMELEKAARYLVEDLDNQSLAETLGQPSVDLTVNDTPIDFPFDDGTAEIDTSADSDPAAFVESPPVPDPYRMTQLTASLPTVIEAENDPSASDTGSREAVDMAAAGSDITIELQSEWIKADKKKKKRGKK